MSTYDPDDGQCDHGLDQALNNCTICNGKDKEKSVEPRLVSSFPARWPGHLSCTHLVAEGESVFVLSDKKTVCEECSDLYEED